MQGGILMDIGALSTAMSQVNIQTQVGCALMENVKEMVEVQGQALSEMIASVPSPAGVGGNIDIKL